MEFETTVLRMIETLESYERGELGLRKMKENIFGLFELGNGREQVEFANQFHEYWDFLEEIVAVNAEAVYKQRIDGEIVPNFKKFLHKHHET